MKKKLTNELPLKILAVLLSFLIWFVIAGINDPIITKSYEIPVEIINESVLLDENKVYEVLNNSDVVTVRVKGYQSAVDSLKAEDIHPVADLKEISFMETVRINVSSSKSLNGIKELTVEETDENLQLSIENEKHKPVEISVKVIGDPEDTYLQGTIGTSNSVVQLSGPESAINKVDSVEATVDISGMSSNVVTSSSLKLYDKEGKVINNSSIKKNITSVSVEVKILATKEVPVELSFMGDPTKGFILVDEILYQPTTVIVAGSESVLEDMQSIVIPKTAIDITDKNTSFQVELDIAPYLPAGVSLDKNKSNGKIAVEIKIEEEMEKAVLIKPERIQIANMPEGFTGTITIEEDIEVIALGQKLVIDSLGEYVAAALDITALMKKYEMVELKAGEYNGELNIGLPEGAKLKNNISVIIEISKIDEDGNPE